MDSVPIVVISGQVPTFMIGNDAFHEADTVGITRSCTKHNYLVKDVNTIQKTIIEGYKIASSGRPGPVVVDLPKDIQNSKTTFKSWIKAILIAFLLNGFGYLILYLMVGVMGINPIFFIIPLMILVGSLSQG